MTLTLTLQHNLAFEASDDRGHSAVLDSRPGLEGGDLGFSPMESLLIAAAACTAMDVISTLRMMRQEVDSYLVEVSGERRAEHPRVYTSIRFLHRLSGELKAESAARAIDLSMTRYCPVNAMLRATAPTTCRYSVNGAPVETLEYPATHVPAPSSAAC